MIQDEFSQQRKYLTSVGTCVMGTAILHSFVESGSDPSTLGCKSGVASQMSWRYHIGFLEDPERWGFLDYFYFISLTSIYFIRIFTWRSFPGSQLFWSLVLETP